MLLHDNVRYLFKLFSFASVIRRIVCFLHRKKNTNISMYFFNFVLIVYDYYALKLSSVLLLLWRSYRRVYVHHIILDDSSPTYELAFKTIIKRFFSPDIYIFFIFRVYLEYILSYIFFHYIARPWVCFHFMRYKTVVLSERQWENSSYCSHYGLGNIMYLK